MLDVKYLYEFTCVVGGPTSVKAYKYIGKPMYFRCDYYRNLLFELLYGDQHRIQRSKIFKVVPVRGEV